MKRSLYLALIILTMTMASCDEGQDTHSLPEDAISIGLSLKPAFDVGLNIDLVQAIIEKGPFKDTLDLAITGDSASGVFTNLARGTYSVEVNMFEDTALVASGSGTAIVRAGRTTVIEITLVFRKGSLVILATWGVPIDSLIAYYPFNGDATDESGNGNSGTVLGATPTIDRFGDSAAAFHFNGSNATVQVPDSPELDLTGSFSFSIWLMLDTVGPYEKVILSKHPYGIIDGYHLSITNQAQIILSADPHFDPTSPRTDSSAAIPNVWQHLAFTYDKPTENWRFYIDNVVVSSGSIDFSLSDISNPLVIGDRPGDPLNVHFEGTLDDIRIFSKALTENEVSALYHEGGW